MTVADSDVGCAPISKGWDSQRSRRQFRTVVDPQPRGWARGGTIISILSVEDTDDEFPQPHWPHIRQTPGVPPTIPGVPLMASVVDPSAEPTAVHVAVPASTESDTDSMRELPSAPHGDNPIAVERCLEDVATHALRAALRSLDELDVQHIFRDRAIVIKSLSRLIRGAYGSNGSC